MCYFCTWPFDFQWMSRVLQAVDAIHQVGIYCLALVPANQLPKVGEAFSLRGDVMLT